MQILSLVAASLALGAPALAQSPTTIEYTDGCGLNPSGTHEARSTLSSGEVLEFRAFDEPGALGLGSGFATTILSVPSPAGQCGLPLPGLGLGSAPGALLINLSLGFANSGPQPVGPNGSAPFLVPVPPNPALEGFELMSQSLLFDLESNERYLSNGARLKLGPQGNGGPDLVVQAVGTATSVVAPGEVATVQVVIANTGSQTSQAAEVKVCDATGLCGAGVVPPLEPGTTSLLQFEIQMAAGAETANPHVFTAEVDTGDQVQETDESNNSGTATKPLFVAQPILIGPAPDFDEDEIIELGQGVALSYKRIEYGPQGAESNNEVGADPSKGGVNPDNGLLEPIGPTFAAPKVDPKLLAELEELGPNEFVELIVTFDSSVPMPQLPDITASQDRFSPENLSALELRVAMFEGVRRARIAEVEELTKTLEVEFNGQILEHYTLGQAFLARVPKQAVGFLAGVGQVRHVERTFEDESTPPDTVADGRAAIDTDPYFNGGATGVSFTALLDTGVRESHTLFTGDDNILFVEDCVNGNSLCNDIGLAGYDGDDDVWDHGTSSAAILTGNSNLGNDSRGVTGGFVDSWKVYSATGLNVTATLRGFDQAVIWGDKVVVAEIQSTQSETGSIAAAADDAFDAGCAVISANGNYGSASGTVASPGNAHKAIGVGAYDVDSGALQGYSGRGPTGDSRYKPDLTAPTNTDTASTTSSTAINNFGGTSGATPYAAGAASVYADWFGLTALTDVDAGKIYAGLLVGGNREWDSPFNNDEGVGEFSLPLGGTLYTGKRVLTGGQNKYVTIDVPTSADTVEVAIWWPEDPSTIHRDIDVYIQRPNGTTSDTSLSVPSVFERVKINNASSGERKIRIHGYSIPPLQSQTVFYAIHVH